MAFATASGASPMNDMNITPLVDVMLVLLIIFMVAAPTLSQRLPLELPQPVPDATPPPDPVTLRIGVDGSLSLNGLPLPAWALDAALRTQAAESPQPVLAIHTQAEAHYGHMASALAAAKRAGIVRMGITELD
jgi:biopolymer transport protein ExbD